MEILIVLLVATFLIAGIVYTWQVYNDFAYRLERLKALAADVRTMQQRGRSVAQAANKHMHTSRRHVESTVSRAVKGKLRGGRLFAVNADPYPDARAVDTIDSGLAAKIQSRDLESQTQITLHREAAEYNALIRQFPRSLVAQSFGFRPWQLKRSPNRRRRNRKRFGKRH